MPGYGGADFGPLTRITMQGELVSLWQRAGRLRLEASSANATTPHRRNLRANVLHPITATRGTFRLMTHDLLAAFIYLAHFGFTEHFRSVLVHASITFLMPAIWMRVRFDTVR